MITMNNVCVTQAVNAAQHRNNDLAIVKLNFIIITWVQTPIVYCLVLTTTTVTGHQEENTISCSLRVTSEV